MTRESAGASDASECALCGAANACEMARAGVGSAEGCWCVREVFPSDLIDRLDREDQGKRCICRACLLEHRSAGS